MSNKISRRAFLKCAGVSAAAVGSASLLSGCKTNGSNTTVNDVKVGDTVKITDGALESFLGTVEEVDLDRGKVRVVVSMFGRETPVELELDQVEPIGG